MDHLHDPWEVEMKSAGDADWADWVGRHHLTLEDRTPEDDLLTGLEITESNLGQFQMRTGRRMGEAETSQLKRAVERVIIHVQRQECRG